MNALSLDGVLLHVDAIGAALLSGRVLRPGKEQKASRYRPGRTSAEITKHVQSVLPKYRRSGPPRAPAPPALPATTFPSRPPIPLSFPRAPPNYSTTDSPLAPAILHSSGPA